MKFDEIYKWLDFWCCLLAFFSPATTYCISNIIHISFCIVVCWRLPFGGNYSAPDRKSAAKDWIIWKVWVYYLITLRITLHYIWGLCARSGYLGQGLVITSHMWLRARNVVKGVVIVPNSLISFYICGRMCQKSVLRVGTSNCVLQVLWDVIFHPFPRYPLLAQSSFFVPDVLIVLGENNSFTLLNGLIHGMYLHCNTNF